MYTKKQYSIRVIAGGAKADDVLISTFWNITDGNRIWLLHCDNSTKFCVIRDLQKALTRLLYPLYRTSELVSRKKYRNGGIEVCLTCCSISNTAVFLVRRLDGLSRSVMRRDISQNSQHTL